MTVKAWLNAFQGNLMNVAFRMHRIYGTNNSIVETRQKLYLKALRTFATYYDENQKALIVRSPGRINLLGTHVDHRGGYVNYMAIDHEMVLVASPRADDRVVLHNADDNFTPEHSAFLKSFPQVEWETGSIILNKITSPPATGRTISALAHFTSKTIFHRPGSKG